MRRFRSVLVALAIGAVLVGCGDDDAEPVETASTVAGATEDGSVDDDAVAALTERLDALDDAVDAWAASTTIRDAEVAAAEARTLVVGDDTTTGLLPSRDGTPGLASPLAGCGDVDRNVLGGSWDDPVERWAILDEAIDEWRPGNNTFPSLPSHPQRVVGWATLTLESDALELAHEYAGHAAIHVRVSREAVASC